MLNANKKAAVRRLQRDLKEWYRVRAEIPSISALPLQKNIQEWHVNIKAPQGSAYFGRKDFMLHLIITFPDNYPSAPPEVQVMSRFNHPNVFGDWICLSMLRPHTVGVPYEGWSSSYSVSSILMQLQTFLFAENVPQDGGYNVTSYGYSSNVIQSCHTFKCGRCCHSSQRVFPGFAHKNSDRRRRRKRRKIQKSQRQHSARERVYDVLWVIIFEHLEVQDLSRTSRVCKYYKQIIASHNVCERLNVSCFHTKKKICDGETILGLPFRVTENPHNLRRNFTSQMDFMSWEAWNSGVRTGVWGEELTHFLPVIINKEHSERVKSLFSSSLSQLVGDERKGLKTGEVLEILATMMNSLVVDFVQNEASQRHSTQVPMRMCEKVLTGYVSLYHMLLWFGHKHPSMIAHANKVVKRFKENLGMRRKAYTPDLGKFLIYVLVSEYQWEDVAREFLDESMTRKVLWTIKAQPQLNSLHPYRERLQYSLPPSLVARRLLMFQTWFMKQFCPLNKKDLLQTLNGYHQRFGCAPEELRTKLFDTCQRILAIQKGGCSLNLGTFAARRQEEKGSSKFVERQVCCLKEWNAYFKFIGFQKMSSLSVNRYLTWCVCESLKAGYHRCYGIPRHQAFDAKVQPVELRLNKKRRRKKRRGN